MCDTWKSILEAQPEVGDTVLVFVPSVCRSETWVYGKDVLPQLMALRALWVLLPKPTEEQLEVINRKLKKGMV